MQSVTSVNLHRFGDGLLLEVVGEGADGEVFVHSTELDLADPEGTRVRPRSPLPAADVDRIAECVGEAGYELTAEPARAATDGGSSPSGE